MCCQVRKLNAQHAAPFLFILTNWWVLSYMYPLLSLLFSAFHEGFLLHMGFQGLHWSPDAHLL